MYNYFKITIRPHAKNVHKICLCNLTLNVQMHFNDIYIQYHTSKLNAFTASWNVYDQSETYSLAAVLNCYTAETLNPFLQQRQKKSVQVRIWHLVTSAIMWHLTFWEYFQTCKMSGTLHTERTCLCRLAFDMFNHGVFPLIYLFNLSYAGRDISSRSEK